MKHRTPRAAAAGCESACTEPVVRNPVAYQRDTPLPGTPLTPSDMSDSKRSDAAQLAQELGSTGSWSEAFIPRSHGSVPASEVPHRYMTSDNQTFDDNAAMTQSELDPPPAYSRSSQVHELPANPVTTTTSVQPAHVLQDGIGNVSDANNGQEESEDGDGLNVQTPLLGGPRSAYLRGWTPWIWQGKTARRRRLRLLCLVILFGVLASILSVLACVFYNSSNAVRYSFPFINMNHC